MAQPILTVYLSNRTLYVVIVYNGQFWNKDTPAFENYSQGNWVHYAVPLTEYTSSGIYQATFPAGIPAGALPTEFLYQQNGGSPILPGSAGGDSFLSLMQSQGANVQTISGSGSAATALSLSGNTIVSAAATAGTLSTSQMTTTLTNTVDSAYNGRLIIWTSGVLQNQATNITAYSHTNGRLTFTAVTNAPTAGDTFIVV